MQNDTTEHITNELSQLAQSHSVPERIRVVCRQMTERMQNRLSIAAIGAGKPEIIQTLSELDSSTNAAAENFHFDFLTPEVDLKKLITLWPNDRWVLALWVPAKPVARDIEDWASQNVIPFERRIICCPTDRVKLATGAFAYASVNLQGLVDWLTNFAKQGRAADLAMAEFLIAKHKPQIDQPRELLVEKSECRTRNLINSEVKKMHSEPDPEILRGCLRITEMLSDLMPPMDQELLDEIGRAHDHIILLELEGTERATTTALALILQIQEQIDGFEPLLSA